MRTAIPFLALAFVTVYLGCGAHANPDGDGKAFLDQKKEIPARKEWNREVVSKQGGKIKYRVTSEGPFAITVVADRSYQAMLKGDKKGVKKEDILLTIDIKEKSYEGTITLPAGSSWFIIENQTDKKVEIRLECFD